MRTNIKFILFFICTFLFSAPENLWDLGVSIHKENKEIVQKEVNLNTLNTIPHNDSEIKALYSNNFIKPIIQEIKESITIDNSILVTYDHNLFTMSIEDKILSIKKSFLRKEFIRFFNIHDTMSNIKTDNKTILTSMYIQNLYYSNQFDEALNYIHNISLEELTDELLLFKIKIYVKLKNIDLAKETIEQFVNTYPDSNLLRYVQHEKKLIDNV